MRSDNRQITVLALFLLGTFCSLGITLGVHSLSHEHRVHLEQVHSLGSSPHMIADGETACLLDLFVSSSFDSFAPSREVVALTFVERDDLFYQDSTIPSFCGHSSALRAPPQLS